MSLPSREGVTPIVYLSRSDFLYCAECADQRQSGAGEVMSPIRLAEGEKETCCDCNRNLEHEE
jgi:hypothetical protein